MVDDYRNTRYCPVLERVSEKKKKVEEAVKRDHKRAIDMHTYISKNESEYKKMFVSAYNGKCAYCGVSLGIINWKQFEIDHFIPKDSPRFSSKSQAGFIENLVLSCFDCNRAKNNYEVKDENRYKVDPDGVDICKSFYRDTDYYIRISNDFLNDESVKSFYYQLKLDSQTHRLDYLLLNMRGLRDSLKDKPEIYILLNEAIELIMKKRK